MQVGYLSALIDEDGKETIVEVTKMWLERSPAGKPVRLVCDVKQASGRQVRKFFQAMAAEGKA